ncbi:hypothetical protein SELMODRAFT_426311 [Selaginella moellendorffii]|nr:uncharacterized protein LOC9645785 [Selaginella moellendorffii]XP_002987570.1 uncharacterized protein LOC9629817 [Selaginella moellendorffii]EFJ11406.1 hypothetical protein SELMODRAFT_426311 [Selaginella moellendorffii]|eukprot:XP_002987570.1 uncharacterized protein LOC9629817 [Selaginella moellendorffii]
MEEKINSGDGEEKRRAAFKHKTGGQGWAKRVLVGSSAATGIGATIGLIGGAAKGHPVRAFALPVTINFAIAGSFLSGMTEVTRAMLRTEPGSYTNTIGGGMISGIVLARLQGIAASPFSMGLLFAAVGTGCQFAANQWDEYRLKKFVDTLPDDAFPEEFRETRKEMVEEANKERSWPSWLPFRKLSEEEFQHKAELARRMKQERGSVDE